MLDKWINEKENLEKLINEDKISYEEIGRRYGCSGANIKKQAKALGIILPQRREINPSETFNKKAKRICPNCGKEVPHGNIYCNHDCEFEYHYKTFIEKWKLGEITGTKGKDDISGYIRRYLLEKYNYKCQLCGWGTVNPYTNKVPLQIHHIDGDCMNNKEENLQLLCPNCHSLTENFGSRNKNATRKDKRLR